MDYDFREIETRWQKYWKEHGIYRVTEDPGKEKYYVLDMFPYPSGAGLHVGHPLGYIASDIYSRYRRLKGYNVLHPMGFDAFGLPAEQYAIQTGQHPSVTTARNIERYREQLDRMGFAFDWSREVQTCDPGYYKWTQWIFLKLFGSWYDKASGKARPVNELIEEFESNGNRSVNAACDEIREFSKADWKIFSEKEKSDILLNYRLAYLSEAIVNWCPALGTVLANDEVKDGFSERGGHPVERKLMNQWSLRITAYADRLLEGLDRIAWSESIKESQRNWIGRSEGAMIRFRLKDTDDEIEVFTTRPDTLFGVTFMVLAPESDLAGKLTTAENRNEVEEYIRYATARSERDRMSEVRQVTGVFSGSYVTHPFTGKDIPVWISEYVLAGYGTGAVMAVPGHDTRDHAFAKKFGLDIIEVVKGGNVEEAAHDAKEGELVNSGFLNGLSVPDAIQKATDKVTGDGIGYGRTNYRLRDAAFGRQRYWGEPIPIYYKDGVPVPMKEEELPLILPEVDKFLPTDDGMPPLGRASGWLYDDKYGYELTTMPGWAGSSWYYLRYMDSSNNEEFASSEKLSYWKDVDLYIGGSEHATGHLLYVRFWTKFLHDLGYISIDEPAQKLINQGMIQGLSCFVYRVINTNKFVSAGRKSEYDTSPIHVDVNLVENDKLDVEAFKKWRPEYESAEFILEDGNYIVGQEVEKMSKSKWNVVSPDDIIDQYGADCLRLYEMFLGPVELSKPWNTNGLSGVSGFLRKFWKLFHTEGEFMVSEEMASEDELRTLHRTIKKVSEDIERFSFNTCVSSFMICTNELIDLKCNKKNILEPLTILLSPFAPHICEELYSRMDIGSSVIDASYPLHDEKYLEVDSYDYPVSVNGKTRFKMKLDLSLDKEEVERRVLRADELEKWLKGATPRKVIVVPGRIVNIVV